MQDNELLTFACVLAILAFGACGGPYRPPAPPPLPPFLTPVHAIAVQVQDASGQDSVDTGTMSRAVASRLNQLWKHDSVQVQAAQPSSHNDANLKIVIVNKAFSCEPRSGSFQLCTFGVTTSSTLTGSAEKPLWTRKHDSHCNYSSDRMSFWQLAIPPLPAKPEKNLPPDPWKVKPVMRQTGSCLAIDLDANLRNHTPNQH